MSFLYILLTPDQERQEVFYKVPIIDFWRAKSLKDILVRAKCSFENVVYLYTCKTCSNQDTGRSEDFQPKFNDYRYAKKNFLKGRKVKQESFNKYFFEVHHNGDNDWEVRLIDHTNNVEERKKRESFW